MTIQGAMQELISLLNADDIPFYYKGGIQKVIETIDDYVRCGECKYWLGFCSRIDGLLEPDADDYCSYGEREGE